MKGEWFALLVFPFKAYVAVVVPFYYIFRMYCPQPFLGTNVTDGTRDIKGSNQNFTLLAFC
jgi:hypothetical protein